MFSQVSVCHSVLFMQWDMGTPLPDTRHEPNTLPPPNTDIGGHQWRPVKTFSLEDLPPPVLTSSGGH